MKYWIDPKISWKAFKELTKPFQGDIVPKHGDKFLWQMLRDRQINMYLSDLKKDKQDPMIITLEDIKGGKIIKS